MDWIFWLVCGELIVILHSPKTGRASREAIAAYIFQSMVLDRSELTFRSCLQEVG